MDTIMIFDVAMIGIGVYMAVTAFNMKKNNEIGTLILAEEEVNKCKDKAGFITYIYWRAAVMGAALVLYGALELMSKYLFALEGFLKYLPLIFILAVLVWFYRALQTARNNYLY